MQLLVLLVLISILLVVNFYISDGDFLSPAVVFCLINLIFVTVAIVMKFVYGPIEFHWNTVLILFIGMFIFMLFNIFSWANSNIRIVWKHRTIFPEIDFTNVTITNEWVFLLIIFEIIVSFFILQYVTGVVRAVDGSYSNIVTAIGRYNSISKNAGEILRASGVSANKIYTLGWPLCISFNCILSCKSIYEKITTGRFPKLIMLSFGIMIFMSFLNGGRSTAFRMITFFTIEYIFIMRRYKKSYKKGNAKLIKKLLPITTLIIIALGFSINLIGRSTSIPIFDYVTAYVGAPIYNLDNFLNSNYSLSTIWGQETFQRFYKFVGQLFEIDTLIYDLNLPYLYFEGHYLGNVYTMYYMFIEDFGVFGVIPLTAFIAFYYTFSYRKLMNFKRPEVGIGILIYGYLFNDLIMLLFSNRFFETIGGSNFIYWIFWVIVLWFLMSQGVFSIKLHLMSKVRIKI